MIAYHDFAGLVLLHESEGTSQQNGRNQSEGQVEIRLREAVNAKQRQMRT